MVVTRDALYAEVWAEPMLKVAERYKVSSSYMARGDLELSLSSQADLDAAKPLILMAYEGRA